MYNYASVQVGFGIATTISVISETFLLISHFTVPKLMKHPGSLILGQCLGHIMIDLHFYTTIKSVKDFTTDIGLCSPIGWATIFAYSLCWNYISCLSLEIMCKITNPASISYKRRVYIYHIGSWTLAALFTILIYTFLETKGIDEVVCFILFDKSGE